MRRVQALRGAGVEGGGVFKRSVWTTAGAAEHGVRVCVGRV